MNKLMIEATEISPKILFDPASRVFEIFGESRPENVREFYEPILNWLDEYGKELFSQPQDPEAKPLTFNFKLEYFNSSSSKFILDILRKIIEYHSKGVNIVINWHFDEGDEDMQEAGEELSKMVNFPFNYLEIEE
jgi:hypothetical protein